MAKKTDKIITRIVEPFNSGQVGQVTFDISLLTSLKYLTVRSVICAMIYPFTLSGFFTGRPGGTRTPNSRFWRPVLYQLNYWPTPFV